MTAADLTRARWCLDYSALAGLLRPYIVTIDGLEYVDPSDAPTETLDLFRALTHIGYSKGWFTK